MTVRIVFSDVDGTLLGTGSNPHADVAGPLLCGAQGAGVILALVSGRPPVGIRKVQGQLGITGPMACFSGSLVLDEAGVPLESHLIPLDVADRVYQALRDRRELLVSATAFDRWVENNPDHPIARRIATDVNIPPVAVRDLSCFADVGGVHKLMVSGRLDDLLRVEDELAPRLPQLTVVRSDDHSLEVMPGGVSKAGAVRALLSHYNIPLADAVAFGDSMNDVEMLRVVPESYAMCTGEAPAKEAAAHVTAWGKDEAGVARTLAGLLGLA